MRIRILVELNKRPMSIKQYNEEFCGNAKLGQVTYNFKVLRDYYWIEEVGKKSGGKRRGGTERFYRAKQPAMFDTETWTALPQSLKGTVTGEAAATYFEHVRKALATGTIDSRADRHFSWIATLVDQRTWDNVIRKVDELFEYVRDEQVQASIRMAETGESAIPLTVGLAAFESPPVSSDG